MEPISVVIPAYNEEDSIGRVLDGIQNAMQKTQLKYEVVVVDDGSTDKTAEVVKSRDVKLVAHDFNAGYGASLKTGIRNAQHEVVVIIDADETYSPEDIPRLLRYIGEYSMVVGARTAENVNIPLSRKPVKWFLSRLSNYLAEYKIPDLNSGLRVFKKGLVEKYFHLLPSGFSFTATITLALVSDDYEVKYVPINYHQRTGKSKIKGIRDTHNFLMLVVRTVMYFNPLKVFLPISFVFFILGIGLLGYDIFVAHNLGDKTVLVLSISFLIGVLGLLADLIVKRT